LGAQSSTDARAVADVDEGRERAGSVEHFYEDIEPLTDLERRSIAAAPNIDRQLMRELWLGATDGGPKTLTELITLPSLNIRGMASSRGATRRRT
jgi:hypothetical protein